MGGRSDRKSKKINYKKLRSKSNKSNHSSSSNDQTAIPKFSAARESRKRAYDGTDFAQSNDDQKSMNNKMSGSEKGDKGTTDNETDDDQGMVYNEYESTKTDGPDSNSSDDDGLVMANSEDDGNKFGGMIETDSDIDDDESDDSDELPEVVNQISAMRQQFMSASDGYI